MDDGPYAGGLEAQPICSTPSHCPLVSLGYVLSHLLSQPLALGYYVGICPVTTATLCPQWGPGYGYREG